MKAPLILSIVAMMSLSTSCKGTINEQTLAPGTPETPVSVKTRIKVASFNMTGQGEGGKIPAFTALLEESLKRGKRE